MEYVYAALLIDAAGQKVTEDGVKSVIKATGSKPDESRVKALVAALDGVDIKEAISKAAPIATASAPVAPAETKAEEVKEEKEAVSEEEAAAGLGALFG
ncbi:MAG: 50S ribosomal protein P1 [Candidatus Nanoarchaeia archaeon]|jgi:large subunit ribosomal protein L12